MRSKQLHEVDALRTLAVVFDTDDEIVQLLLDFAEGQGLTAASLTGIGAFRRVVLGYFAWESKTYEEIHVDEQVELLSLAGNVARNSDGQPKIHAHVVVGKRDGTAMGGHLISGLVRPTAEVVVNETPAHLARRHDEETGLPLIDVQD